MLETTLLCFLAQHDDRQMYLLNTFKDQWNIFDEITTASRVR